MRASLCRDENGSAILVHNSIMEWNIKGKSSFKEGAKHYF